MEKIACGVIGATGMVGQNYIRLLEGHPWFDVCYVAASPSSAGKSYQDAVAGRWLMETNMPDGVKDLLVHDASDIASAKSNCRFVFSAVSLDKSAVLELENAYAQGGVPVVSNNSAHRSTRDVPILIPEINADHIEVLPIQQKNHGWDHGFVVVKPNCSVQSYMIPIHALIQRQYEIKSVMVVTLQGLSGGGYPGPSSLDMVDNIIPFIPGEEEKSEREPLKILGHVSREGVQGMNGMKIAAHCNRVPVLDGHTACVSIQFGEHKPTTKEIIETWETYRSVPQELGLPSAPLAPIVYRTEPNRPQPRKDRHTANGMSIVVGRLRPCNVMGIRFVGLSHNTVRGAAGGGILNAELLCAKGFL